jgi:hypothetical protein
LQHGAILLDEFLALAQHGEQEFTGIVWDGPDQACGEVLSLNQAGHDAQQHILLVFKIVIQRAFRDVGDFSDVFGRGTVETFLGKQACRGIQDLYSSGSDTPLATGMDRLVWLVQINLFSEYMLK